MTSHSLVEPEATRIDIMYSHQVLERLKEDTDSPLIKEVYDLIRISQRFHLGESSDVAGFLSEEHRDLFCGPVLGGVRLPYRICWFDYWRDIKILNLKEIAEQKAEFDNLGVMCGISTKRGYLIKEDLDQNLWIVWIFAYLNERDVWEVTPVRLSIPIEDGVPMGGREFYVEAASHYDKRHDYSNEVSDYMSKVALEDLLEVNIFLSLLSCKNVTTEAVEPSVKLNKKRRKKGKEPLSIYKVLKLKPFGSAKAARSLPAGQAVNSSRLHLCRGHFKVFTEEAPLFGRITGRYWWQPQVRGSKSKGIVVKDYKLEPK